MKPYSPGQLAEIRRQQLIADATRYRQIRTHRPSSHPTHRLRRPITAFQNWLAAGQL